MVGHEIENEVGLPFVAHSSLAFDLMTHADLIHYEWPQVNIAPNLPFSFVTQCDLPLGYF